MVGKPVAGVKPVAKGESAANGEPDPEATARRWGTKSENSHTPKNTAPWTANVTTSDATPIDSAMAQGEPRMAIARINEKTAQTAVTANTQRSENCGMSIRSIVPCPAPDSSQFHFVCRWKMLPWDGLPRPSVAEDGLGRPSHLSAQ